MFVAILNWMVAHTPGILRPAVNWLIEGLSRITGFIASRWNTLGVKVSGWMWSIAYFKDRVLNFARATLEVMTWVKNVYIPTFVGAVGASIRQTLNDTANWLRGLIEGGLATLRHWTEAVANALGSLIDAVQRFAQYWIDQIIAYLASLVQGLEHVLSGPQALAEWLVAAMWQAGKRYVYAQRDRIAQWILRESTVASRWLAAEIENIILRWL